MSMQVGALRLTLRIPGAQSLKDKRRVVHMVRDRVRARFEVACAEVESLDDHRVAVIGVALVGNDARVLRQAADRVVQAVASWHTGELLAVEVDIAPFTAADPFATSLLT